MRCDVEQPNSGLLQSQHTSGFFSAANSGRRDILNPRTVPQSSKKIGIAVFPFFFLVCGCVGVIEQSTFSSSSLTMLPERERETPRHCTATGRAGLRPTAAAVSSQVCRFRLPRFFRFFFFLTLGNFTSSRRFLCVLGGDLSFLRN